MILSFKNRIALFTALAAAVTIALVFLLVYAVVYYSAYYHLDNDIRMESADVLESLHDTDTSLLVETMPEWYEQEHQETEINPVFLQLTDAGGHIRFRSSNLQNRDLQVRQNAGEQAFFTGYIGEEEVRQGQFTIRNQNDLIIGHLVIALSSEESSIVLHNLRNTLWFAFPALLLVLFGATSLAAAKGIAPVRQLINAASRMAPPHFTSKLPLPHTRDEIYQLATTFNDLLQRLDLSLQREKQFTSDASHEMRTPLTAIKGILEVLIRKPRQTEQYEAKIKLAIQEVNRLQTITDQLLQIAKVENTQISIRKKSLHLHPFLLSLQEKARQSAGAHVNFLTDVPPSTIVATDPDLLYIIIDNIIGNAAKYSPDRGIIHCRWEPDCQTLVIQDHGPGISPDQLPFIFDRFFRTDAARHAAIPGAGLGLSIAKKLADLLDIRLTATSTQGKGVTMRLEFKF